MEHFKKLAFCMLYLFTFIWQLSAQVKKIPQWGAVRDSVARYCQRNFISDVAGDNINKKPLLLQWFFSCRNEATRTPDPYVPNVVRYQLRYIPIAFEKWCHQESNRGHKDFQSFALPTELWHLFRLRVQR